MRKFWIMVALSGLLALGCSAQIAGQDVRIRPGRRVPDRIVQHGEQQDVVIDGIDGDRRAFLLLVRGSF